MKIIKEGNATVKVYVKIQMNRAAVDRALMRLGSSGIMTAEHAAKSPGARRRTRGESPESSRWRTPFRPARLWSVCAG
jgi:hypothetical protein